MVIYLITNIMNEQFIKFLKKHGALRKFKYNLKVSREDYDINDHIGNIGGGFTWSDTPEGQDYWSNLNTLWSEYEFKSAKRTK